MKTNGSSCKHSLKSTSIENKKTKPWNALRKLYKRLHLETFAIYLFLQKRDKQEKTQCLECYSKTMQVIILPVSFR